MSRAFWGKKSLGVPGEESPQIRKSVGGAVAGEEEGGEDGEHAQAGKEGMQAEPRPWLLLVRISMTFSGPFQL